MNKLDTLIGLLTVPLLLVLISFSLQSCAGVGAMVGGSVHTYQGEYSIQLSAQQDDILEAITTVGSSMGLEVSMIDKAKGKISLSNYGSPAESGLIGKMTSQSIDVQVAEAGKKLQIQISVQGNFGSGTKEGGDKLFAEFKNKLLEKIK